MGRSHGHYCVPCDSWYSPFDFDACPGCGDLGHYINPEEVPELKAAIAEIQGRTVDDMMKWAGFGK